jgi:hypothetical protein
MTDYSELLSAVTHLVIKNVLATDPSIGGKYDGGHPRFKLFGGEDIEESSKETRVFDVVGAEEGPEDIFVHQSARDYDVPIVIEVEYPNDRHFNNLAFSDYDKIRWSVMLADKSAANNIGFNFFRFARPLIDEPEEDSEYRFMRIPVICRVTVAREPFYPVWQDGITGTEYQDTSWAEREIQDQPNG